MKKVFSILFIFLIFLVLSVSVFAESETETLPPDYMIPLSNLFNPNLNNCTRTGDISDFTLSNFSVWYSGFTSGRILPGHRYIITFTSSSSINHSQRFTVLQGGSVYYNTIYFSTSLTSQFYTFEFTYDGTSNGVFWFQLDEQNSSIRDSFSISFYGFNLFDVTGTDLTVSSLQNYIDIHEFYPREKSSAFLIGFFDPFIEFHSNLFSHLVEPFSYLTSTYSAVFVFVAICLSLLFVIFLIFMVIRRCRNI